MDRPLRFGVIGCARIVKRAVAAAMRRAPSAELVAIASRQAEVAAQWARDLDLPRYYNSYEALVADPEIDAVYLPLPNELHRPWALAAAAAGKHVLCEKPLGLDEDDARQIVDGCCRHNVLLMEAFMWRHHPRVAYARKLLAEGALGELRLVKMDFSFDIDRTDWRLDPARGGGALYDLGCYGINAARLFAAAEPVEVFARATRHTTGVDMTMALQLRFPNQVHALLDCSFECPKRNRLELVGTHGALEFPGGVLPAEESELIYRHGDSRENLRFPPADQYAQQIETFCQSVRAGRLLDPAEDGLANMRAVEWTRRVAQQTPSTGG